MHVRSGGFVMQKKYIGTNVAMTHAQKTVLDQVSRKMKAALHIELSRAAVVERLCNLYLAGKLEGGGDG